MIRLKIFFRRVCFLIIQPMTLYAHKTATKSIDNNLIFHECIKNIEVHCNFNWDVVLSKKIITLVFNYEQVANLLIKTLNHLSFSY